ncbi:MAG: polynucleotide adenylyltransferase PcnB [Polyangiaceae bacterium]|nr:polynucleotide adenylyltransferase PcnB [Polyangiaceae bacterium]
MDPDVRKVLRRLVRHGHEAYLVGGCVRDLLLDRRPKDFDVATSARPEEIRELFRNSRIIGRRFRLVHVLFQGGKVIEVATFRRNPKDEADDGAELLIRSDNVFGAAHEDAVRRDFTMNALFYDLEARQILDWVGGMEDVRRRVVHTIGDPETRFREDPVRILRALKFAGRLGFAITPDVYDAIVYCREALALAARPRLSEEILRLMRGGQARRTMYLAWETGVLDVLLPELSALLYDEGEDGAGPRLWKLLDYIDKRTAESRLLDDTVLWTLLLLEPLREACDGARDRSTAAGEFLEPIIERLAVSRRYSDGMRRIVALLPRLASGRAGRFAKTDVFASAVDVVTADLLVRGESLAVVDRLRTAVGGKRLKHERRSRFDEA